MKIYTKIGDDGITSLAGGTRIMKDDIRVETYGTIDELNSFIGLLSSCVDEPFLETIQKNLFRVGGYFSDEVATSYRLNKDDIIILEERIDSLEAQLEPLNNFILPRGNQMVCLCHVCRTVCRRAERRMVECRNSLGKELDADAFAYINRLSDFFFVLSRKLNKEDGREDIIL